MKTSDCEISLMTNYESKINFPNIMLSNFLGVLTIR